MKLCFKKMWSISRGCLKRWCLFLFFFSLFLICLGCSMVSNFRSISPHSFRQISSCFIQLFWGIGHVAPQAGPPTCPRHSNTLRRWFKMGKGLGCLLFGYTEMTPKLISFVGIILALQKRDRIYGVPMMGIGIGHYYDGTHYKWST